MGPCLNKKCVVAVLIGVSKNSIFIYLRIVPEEYARRCTEVWIEIVIGTELGSSTMFVRCLLLTCKNQGMQKDSQPKVCT